MSFLKQLLNPFIEFDADGKKTAPQAGSSPASQAAPPPAAKASALPATAQQKPVTPAPPPTGPAQHPLISDDKAVAAAASQVPTFSPSGTLVEPLPEHVQYFEKLVDDANRSNPYFQGTDYKEFVDSKIDIDDIADESLKYRTAYNVLKSTGLTKEKLLATGQEYLNLIGRDMNAFQGAHAQKYKKEVEQKEALIQKKAEELQALVQRMNNLKAEINQLTQDISLTKETLITTKSSFLLAGERKQVEIETELQKIMRYFT